MHILASRRRFGAEELLVMEGNRRYFEFTASYSKLLRIHILCHFRAEIVHSCLSLRTQVHLVGALLHIDESVVALGAQIALISYAPIVPLNGGIESVELRMVRRIKINSRNIVVFAYTGFAPFNSHESAVGICDQITMQSI